MTLRELVQRSGLDQGTVDNICKNMEEAIEAKNSILRNLKYSLAHAIKAYNDAIRVYEAKLLEFGIPADELGIEPLVTNTSTMPAGLVAAWKTKTETFQIQIIFHQKPLTLSKETNRDKRDTNDYFSKSAV